jgi:hypothetical protein
VIQFLADKGVDHRREERQGQDWLSRLPTGLPIDTAVTLMVDMLKKAGRTPSRFGFWYLIAQHGAPSRKDIKWAERALEQGRG